MHLLKVRFPSNINFMDPSQLNYSHCKRTRIVICMASLPPHPQLCVQLHVVHVLCV